jgi:Icc-related predicted phosphoesterase
VIRIAAVADLHVGRESAGTLRPHFSHLSEQADVLLLAGDLTRVGDPAEAEVLVEELADVLSAAVPVVAVLGNHDYHDDRQAEIVSLLEEGGIDVLEGEQLVIELEGGRLGVAGSKGFGGGFAGACGSDFGEPEMKAFVRHTKVVAGRLESCLRELDADVKIALLHYSPVPETLRGEPLEIYPFLGSYLLAEAIDLAGANLALHGHAHRGSEQGVTAGGVQVRNVAQSVINRAYALFCFDGAGSSPAVMT